MTQTGVVVPFPEARSKKVETATESQDTLHIIQQRLVALEQQIAAGRSVFSSATPTVVPGERVKVEKLYQDLTDSQSGAEVIRAREILTQCISSLNAALSDFESEIERENHIEVCFAHFSALDHFTRLSLSFGDAVTLVQMATAAHRATPYKVSEIVGLKLVLETMRESPNMGESTLAQCTSKLEENGFNLAGPLAEINLNELV